MKRIASRGLVLGIATVLAACSAPRDRTADAESERTAPAPQTEATRNYATYDPAVARGDEFEIGRREPASPDGAATLYRSSSALVLSSTNVNRERIYLQGPSYTPPVTEKYQHQSDN